MEFPDDQFIVPEWSTQEYSLNESIDDVPSTSASIDNNGPRPRLVWVEKPVNAFRFRYESEMTGTHGCITGETSNKETKQSTFPTVKVENVSNGDVTIRCTLQQTSDEMDIHHNYFKPHPHKLLMKKKKCKTPSEDPHDIIAKPQTNYTAAFKGMGIIHTAKKDVETQLNKKISRLLQEKHAREGVWREFNKDDIKMVNDLTNNAKKHYNSNMVCLRFDALKEINGVLQPICEPLISDVIKNLKSADTGVLKIVRSSECVCYAEGNREMVLLVEKISKDVGVRFFEVDDADNIVWEDKGRFSPLDIHHQFAIVLRTPPYKDQDITVPVPVFIQLVRKSDNATSEPFEFIYHPNPYPVKKRKMEPQPSNKVQVECDPLLCSSSATVQTSCPGQRVEPRYSAIPVPSIDSAEFAEMFNNNWKTTEFENLLSEADLSKQEVLPYDQVLVPQETNTFIPTTDINVLAHNMLVELKNMSNSPNCMMQRILFHLGEQNTNRFLHLFLRMNRTSDLDYLLQLVANFRQNHLLNIRDDNYQTLLHLAIISKNVDLVRKLLNLSVDVSLLDANGNNALHLAIQYELPLDIIQLIVTQNRDLINLENNNGDTPLLIAIGANNLSSVQILCNTNGVDVTKRNSKTGISPIFYAITQNDHEIIEYLNQVLQIKSFLPVVYNEGEVSSVAINEVDTIFEFDMTNENHDSKQYLMEIPTIYLESLYENVNNFTMDSLDKISAILSRSSNWQDLLCQLGLKRIIANGLVSDDRVVFIKKMLLEETRNSGNILKIRSLLESMNEVEAVTVLDTMALEQNQFLC